MFAFISTAYLILFPLLLIMVQLASFSYRKFSLNLRASTQFSLIFYSIYLVRQLIGLYQFRKMFHMPAASLDYLGSGLIEMVLIILLPFLFLIKRVLHSWILGFLIWMLLLHSTLRQEWILQFDGLPMINAILFYISLLTTIYALLWLLKKFKSFSLQ